MPFETEIEIPNIKYQKCTLRIIQLMAERVFNADGDYFYHRYSDLQITAAAKKPIITRSSGQR